MPSQADTAYMASDPTGMPWLGLALEHRLYPVAGRAAPWFAAAAALLCASALYIGFFRLPHETVLGEHHRILLIHLPATWMALFIYFAMAAAAGLGLFGAHRLSAMVASALAPTGGVFAFLALWTGSLWGKPSWGVWWVWDAQLTCALLLLALFLAVVMLQTALDDARRADRAAAVLVLCGLIALPVVYASMVRWGVAPPDSLLAPAMRPGTMDTLLAGMLVMGAGLAAYTVAAALTRLRTMILERERRSEWAAHLAGD